MSRPCAGEFMLARYREVVELVLQPNYRESKEKLIRSAVVKLIPLLAGFAPERFAVSYLQICMDHLLNILKYFSALPILFSILLFLSLFLVRLFSLIFLCVSLCLCLFVFYCHPRSSKFCIRDSGINYTNWVASSDLFWQRHPLQSMEACYKNTKRMQSKWIADRVWNNLGSAWQYLWFQVKYDLMLIIKWYRHLVWYLCELLMILHIDIRRDGLQPQKKRDPQI